MKKIYTLLALCFLANIGVAQTVIIYPTGSTLTGYATAATNVTGNMSTIASGSANPRRAWSVFNLAVLPAGITVTSCTFGYNQTVASGGAGTPTVWSTKGYNGNITSLGAGTRYTAIGSAPIIATSAYPFTAGNQTIASTPAMCTFIENNAGGFATIATQVTTSTRTWTWSGGASAASTIGTHRPYLQITYNCTGVSGVAASATPNPVCIGSTLSLTGAATGATSYSWSGPGGFSSALQDASLTATATSAGTYTFTAFNAAGCPTKSTVVVTTNPTPAPITGATNVCFGTVTTLSTTSTGGTWSINGTTGATIAGGVVTPGTVGTSTVTYAYATGCMVSTTVTTSDTPTAIIGPSYICTPSSVTLTSSPSGGTWTISPGTYAGINATTGEVNSVLQGLSTVTYTGINTCHTSRTLQVIQPPATAITSSTGSFLVCPSLSLTLSNAISGGIWSCTSGAATINSSTGYLTGVSVGLAPITYSNQCGIATTSVSVNPPPPPITGVFSACENAVSALHDSVTTGVWSSNNTSIAAVGAGTGVVMGVAAGSTTITYTDATGCVALTPFLVNPNPAAIIGPPAVCNGSTINLVEITPGGYWTSADSFIAKVDSFGIVKGRSVNTTTIRYTLPITGCYITHALTVNPLPVPIMGNNVFCNQSSDSLYDFSTGGTWTSGNPGIAVISATGKVTGITGGNVVITYTLPTSCYVTRMVTIHALPNPAISYNWATATFTTNNYFVTYQWYQAGVILPGANSYNLAVFDNDIYKVEVTDTFGCTGFSAAYNMNAVGVGQTGMDKLVKIHPNPTSGYVKIESPVNVKAVITSIDGKVVMEQNNASEMNISTLSTGMYMITLYDDAGHRLTVEKLIKE